MPNRLSRGVTQVGGLAIGGVKVTATAADLNSIAGSGAALARSEQTRVVALVASDAAGGVFAWANPETTNIIVTGVVLNVTTKATGACTLDVGTTAVSAATKSDNVIDGVDVGTAAGVFNTIDQAGVNGKARQLLAPGKWVTGSMDSGATAGLAGFAYVYYQKA